MGNSTTTTDHSFHALFWDAPFPIYLHCVACGKILDCNPAAWHSYGCENQQEFEAMDIWMDPPYSREDAIAWMQKALREGLQRYEWCSRKRGGELFWEELHLLRMNVDGQDRVVLFAIDISARKSAELLTETSPRNHHASLPGTALPPEHLFLLKDSGHEALVSPRDIALIHSQGDYTDVFLTDTRRFCVHKTLKSWIQALPASEWVQIDRFTLLRPSLLRGVDLSPDTPARLHLQGLPPHPVSQTGARQADRILKNHI